MKKPVLIALCLALCLVMALSGTIAYLTDSDSDANVMTLGNVYIELQEFERDDQGDLKEFDDFKMLHPLVGDLTARDPAFNLPQNSNFMDKIVLMEGQGKNANAFLRVYIGVPSALRNVQGMGIDAVSLYMAQDMALPGSHTDAWPWALDSAHSHYGVEIDGIPFDMICYNYQKLLQPGEQTPPLLAGLYLDSRVDNGNGDGEYTIWLGGVEYPLDYDFAALGLQIPVLAQAMQADGFANAGAAFQAGAMNDVDFDALLDLKSLPDEGPSSPATGVAAELIKRIADVLMAGSDENGGLPPVDLSAGEYDLSSPEFNAQLDALMNAMGGVPDGTSLELLVGNGVKVEIHLGKSTLPEGFTLSVDNGAELILTAEPLDD